MTFNISLVLLNFVSLPKSREAFNSECWDFPNCFSSSWHTVIIDVLVSEETTQCLDFNQAAMIHLWEGIQQDIARSKSKSENNFLELFLNSPRGMGPETVLGVRCLLCTINFWHLIQSPNDHKECSLNTKPAINPEHTQV